jgi:PilZ domain
MAENRKAPRQVFHYNARISAEPNAPQVKCMITDVSKTGAHLVLEIDEPLADKFLLLFTPQGWPRRNCSLAWRKGREVGVSFKEE